MQFYLVIKYIQRWFLLGKWVLLGQMIGGVSKNSYLFTSIQLTLIRIFLINAATFDEIVLSDDIILCIEGLGAVDARTKCIPCPLSSWKPRGSRCAVRRFFRYRFLHNHRHKNNHLSSANILSAPLSQALFTNSVRLQPTYPRVWLIW